MLLFLHGAGGVNNPENVLGQSLMRMLTQSDYADKVNTIVVAPIAPKRPWQPHLEKVRSTLTR
jgi:hypothetical protein